MKISKHEKQKLMLSIVIAMVLFSLFNNFFLSGIKGNIKKNKTKITALQTELSSLAIKVSKIGKREKEKKQLKKERSDLALKFIEKSDSKTLGDKITENGKKYNLQFNSIKYFFNDKDGHEGFYIDVNLTTNYKNLVNYLNSIEKMEKYIKLRKTEISVTNEGINANLLLSAYIMPSKEDVNEQE